MKINVLGVEYNAEKGTNFGPRITPEDAACILRHAEKIGKSHTIAVRCKEYGHGMDGGDEPDPDDVADGQAVDPEAWAEVYYEDYDDDDMGGSWPPDCETFEMESGYTEVK